MNAAHHIAAAEAALRTNQPNLAMLHMRRATEYLAEARYKSALQTVLDVMSDAFRPVIEFVRAVGEALSSSLDQTKADYALAGPSKGGTA